MNQQQKDTKQPRSLAADVASIPAIIAALYDVISFPPNGAPDWERLRALFIPGGRVIPPRSEGQDGIPVMTVAEFIAWGSQVADQGGLRAAGFYEKQVACTTETFGNIAHVFSTYESRFTAADPDPFERGINSIQLAWDDNRWWAVTIFWDIENPEKPIPQKYLP